MVPIWITHNEPWVVSFEGNWHGVLAPGITDFSTALLVSHGRAVSAYRKMGLKGEIGITLNLVPMYPASKAKEDVRAAKRSDGFYNRWFLDPVFKGAYPSDMLEWYSQRVVVPEITREDLEIISVPIDFLGVNYYASGHIKAEPGIWPLDAMNVPTGRDKTDTGPYPHLFFTFTGGSLGS